MASQRPCSINPCLPLHLTQALGAPKVALLFLTRGPMHHEEMWRLWFASAAGMLPIHSTLVSGVGLKAGRLGKAGASGEAEGSWLCASPVDSMLDSLRLVLRRFLADLTISPPLCAHGRQQHAPQAPSSIRPCGGLALPSCRR